MNVIAKDRFLIKLDDDGNPQGILCNEVEVEGNIIDLVSGDSWVKLKIYRADFEDTYVLERKNFNQKKLFEFLNSKNVKIPDNDDIIYDVYGYIRGTDDSAPDVYQHKQMGFVTINGELCFLAHNPIGISTPQKATSTYHNPLVSEPVGTMDGWLDFINTEVIGHTKLELALALAVLGPITYYFRSNKVIQTNPAINIAGRSSSGKTTFLRICASVYGSPDEATGLISDLHSTENAFSARLAQCYGLPLFCDESTLQPDWDFTKFGYAVSKGVDKLRCNQDGSLKDPNRFFSPLIITGETKLLDNTKKTEGLYARFVTITQPLTDNAEQAERITAACSANYGHAVYPLIEWLMANHNTLYAVYEADVDWFKNNAEDSGKGVHSRILKTYALIVTSARVAMLVWKVGIDIAKMQEFLLSIFKEQLPESNRIKDLYDKLMAGVAAHQSKFYKEKNDNNLFLSDCWGKYEVIKGVSYVYVSSEAIAKILKNDGTIDTLTLKELEAAGLVMYFTDRYFKQITLGKVKVGCYCFRAEAADSPSTTNTKPKKKKKKYTSTSKILCLLTDDDDDEIMEIPEDDDFEIESQNTEQPTGDC